MEACTAKELSHNLYICGWWQFSNKLNFGLIHFNSLVGDDMPQDNSLIHHKLAFLLIEHQVIFNAPIQHSFKVGQAILKNIPIYGDIIHIHLHNALHHIAKNAEHKPLESGRCFVEAKGHLLVGISAKWASEGGLLLVLYSNLYLKVS